MIRHTPATTHYRTAGLVWVHGTPMLLRMSRPMQELHFDRAIAHCTGADARLLLTNVSRTPLFSLSMRWDDGHGERRTVLTGMTDSGRVASTVLVRMQRRWRRVRHERQQRRLALAMGAHPRLARHSPLYALDGELIRFIARRI